MDIWILVIVLLVIAIILFVLSMFASDDEAIDEQLDELANYQSEEIYNLQTRLAELERIEQERDDIEVFQNFDSHIVEPVEAEVIIEEVELTDDLRDEIIKLYSHGYTMNEISDQIQLRPGTVREIVDDYIENR